MPMGATTVPPMADLPQHAGSRAPAGGASVRTRLVVLFGGQSAEHDISRISARHVLAAADPGRYDVVPIAITKDGHWLAAREAVDAIAADPGASPELLPVSGPAVEPAAVLASSDDARPTVVLPLLHGPMGEDGTVQGMLEMAGVPFVGCGVLSSALAMDKTKAKEVFAANGIPQVAWSSFGEGEVREVGVEAFATELLGSLTRPIFVKPANMGSSIGISKARDVDELMAAIELAFTYDEWVVAEEGIIAREIECAVLGNQVPRASVPGEIVTDADFYDYEDKYFGGTAETIIPADLDLATAAELQDLAVRAFVALRCEGLARVDFFFESPGRGLLVNEINTMPGFTPISMYPQLWQATGLSYQALIDELVALAIERHARRAAKRRID